ncbi:transporter substrate-binding domain-containing protein [Aliiglaciecola sp. CAU 1673]|uniref:substrate-binding periplasmic protein n=1 Tax=Aliiglaciecola sp. CAU 1673 TaxID=3032595 RepID=UPI0023DB904C|nr:transporter substrate-binding domain-containing protein [Aliiglaciecola sp. CAU 1673]MDF2178915.1 transporter substrate-binding domain-containing protein [Aliiglaciecola sp. CAU 1673]
MLRIVIFVTFYSVHLIAVATPWVAVTEDAPPLQYIVDGQVRGVTTKLVRDVLAQAKIPARFEVYPWARAFDKALKRQNTLLYSTIRTPERESQLQWIGKLGRFHLSFMALEQNTEFQINSTADAKSYVIGAMRDDYTHDYLLAHGLSDKNLVVRSSLQELLDLLYKGLIDSFVVDRYLVCDLAAQYDYDCSLMRVVYEVPELSVDVYLAANKDSEPSDLARLVEAFKTVKARPEYQKGFAGY